MGKFDHLFRKMEKAKPIGDEFAERLGMGEHVLMLKSYGGKDSDQEMGTILEAEFEVVESSVYKPGEVKGMAWWPEMSGWAGKYNEARGKEFAQAIADGLGETLSISEIGAKLIDDEQEYRGILIGARVTRGKPKKDDNKKPIAGEFYENVKWVPIPDQTVEQVAEAREALDAKEPKEIAPAKKAAATTTKKTAASEPVEPDEIIPAPAKATGKPSLLSGYRRG